MLVARYTIYLYTYRYIAIIHARCSHLMPARVARWCGSAWPARSEGRERSYTRMGWSIVHHSRRMEGGVRDLHQMYGGQSIRHMEWRERMCADCMPCRRLVTVSVSPRAVSSTASALLLARAKGTWLRGLQCRDRNATARVLECVCVCVWVRRARAA